MKKTGTYVVLAGMLTVLTCSAQAQETNIIYCREGSYYNGFSNFRVYTNEQGYFFSQGGCESGRENCWSRTESVTRVFEGSRPTFSFENENVKITPLFGHSVSVTYKKSENSYTISGCEFEGGN